MLSPDEGLAAIRKQLEKAFQPATLEIIDVSHQHAGHAGAQTGKGHFNVIIVSDKFKGASMLECHRMVYESLGDLMLTDIHALSIQARAPE